MSAALTVPIESGTTHLWFLETATFGEPSTAQQWLSRLEPAEQLRHSRYRTSTARDEYLATRALVRTALSRYSGEPAERLRFGVSQHGRPEMTAPAMPELRFSLANTKQLAVGLFASERDVGVDVELVAPIAALELAGRYFSARELAELSTLDGAVRLSRFYEGWTLREAYLKARGIGLGLPLEQLDFQPSRSGSVLAQFGPAIGDDPERWQFGLTWLSEHHLAATCIRRANPDLPTRIVPIDARAVVAETAQ